MATVTIDGHEYDLEKLSNEARQQVTNLGAVDAEIRRVQALLAIYQTARGAYVAALQRALPKQ